MATTVLLCGLLFGVGAVIPSLGFAQDTPAEESERLEPTKDLNPTHVSKRLIRGIAAGKWPLDRFLDQSKGVALIQMYNHDDDDLAPFARRLCGKVMRRHVGVVVGAVLDELLTVEFIDQDYKFDEFECQNDPVQKCVLHGLADAESESTELHFVRKPGRGIYLDMVLTVPNMFAMGQERFLSTQIKRLAKKRCQRHLRLCPKPCAS